MSDNCCDFSVDYKNLTVLKESGTEDFAYPLIVSVPHAGTLIPDEFSKISSLTQQQLLSNADLFVNELAEPLAFYGIPVLSLQTARSFIDVNRDKIELDANMFFDYPTDKIAIQNNRCRFGLGLIHRIDAYNNPIYNGLISYKEVQQRIKNVYDVYHKRLQQLIGKCLKKFGVCLLLDYHSMPSKICGIIPDNPKIDCCLGDLFSQSCPPQYTAFLQEQLQNKGYMTTVNVPYSGAFTTFNYCQPRRKIYTLQLEINRSLYADEKSFKKNNNFQSVSADTTEVVHSLAKKMLDF